jgi:hypothetical protein
MGKLEISQRRIDANRRNAMRSTGPKTEEGKAQSRRNSLIHGLAGDGVVVPEDEGQAASERAEQWISSLRPMNAFEMGLVETIAIEGVRIDRCRIEERLVRDVRARRAGACWFDERKAEAAKLGRTLGERPDEVGARLCMTSAGCDWMILRWRALEKVLDKKGEWNDEQCKLALDLMGVGDDIRAMNNPLEAVEEYDRVAHLRGIIEDELAGLAARQEEALDMIDDDLREATTMGLVAVDDPTLILLRRYETASFRRQRWALDMLHRGRQKPTPVPVQARDDYRERPRQVPYPYVWTGPVPTTATDPDSTPPTPEPEAPTPGPGTDRDRPPQDKTPRSEYSQPADAPRPVASALRPHQAQRPNPADARSRQAARVARLDRTLRAGKSRLAERTHLSGLFGRLARSLAGQAVAITAAKPISRPDRRPSRPTKVQARPVFPDMLRLLTVPAA